MKPTTLPELAQRRRMTLGRAAAEVLAAAGEIPRRYPAVIRRQKIPDALLRQARYWYQNDHLTGPRAQLP